VSPLFGTADPAETIPNTAPSQTRCVRGQGRSHQPPLSSELPQLPHGTENIRLCR